jgi:hypothetical protein
MSNFSLKQFQTEVRVRGLAKQNRFEIQMPTPNALGSKITQNESRMINMFCETTSLPTQTIGVRAQRIYGPAYPRPVSTDYGGDGIALTFLVDQSMDIKNFFDAWLSMIVDPHQYFVHYQSDYIVPIRISQLDNKDRVVYSVVLEDAFPRSVQMLEVNNTAQNSVHKLTVNFVYRRWTPVHRITDSIAYPGVLGNVPVVVTPLARGDVKGVELSTMAQLKEPIPEN